MAMQTSAALDLRHVPNLAGLQGAKALPRQALGVQRLGQFADRLVHRFVGEVESAPVAAGGEGGLA